MTYQEISFDKKNNKKIFEIPLVVELHILAYCEGRYFRLCTFSRIGENEQFHVDLNSRFLDFWYL